MLMLSGCGCAVFLSWQFVSDRALVLALPPRAARLASRLERAHHGALLSSRPLSLGAASCAKLPSGNIE
jgi:hypothetical protein